MPLEDSDAKAQGEKEPGGAFEAQDKVGPDDENLDCAPLNRRDSRACGSPRWLTCCFVPCGGSTCCTPALKNAAAAPSASAAQDRSAGERRMRRIALALAAARPLGTAKCRFEYGWVRGAGSAAFIVGSVLAGQAIVAVDLDVIIWGGSAFLVAAAWQR